MSFPPRMAHRGSDESGDIKQNTISSPLDETTEAPQRSQSYAVAVEKEQAYLRKKEIVTFWLLFVLSIAFGVAVSYGVLGPSYLKKPFEKTLTPGYGSGIFLSGVVNNLDIDSTSMNVQWLVYSCEEQGPYAGCNALTDATNFFVDANAAPSNTFDPSTAALVYKGNLTGYVVDGLCLDQASCWQEQLQRGVPYEQTIQTSHQFSTRPAAYNWRANSQAYPFDVYIVHTTFLALNPASGTSRQILGVALTGTVPNFLVEMQSRPIDNPSYPSYEWRMVTIKISRAQIVVGYAFLIWLINWLMTGVVMWITISAVQGRRRIPADLFGIPITALFALPTVRAIMPGAPFFGCILDYSGIILNLAVLTICSVALLLSVIARDARELYSPPPRRTLLPAQPGILGKLLPRRRSTAPPVEGGGLGLSHLEKV